MQTFDAVGRRKNAVARVRLMPGTGKRIINNIQMKKYLQRETLEMIVEQPLQTVGLSDNFDVYVNVYGGGSTGQAEAVRMALARVMCEVGEGNRAILKPEGLLTRDPRMVERKKFGQKKARKRFQFSKR